MINAVPQVNTVMCFLKPGGLSRQVVIVERWSLLAGWNMQETYLSNIL